jgi:putative transcriptional regulator
MKSTAPGLLIAMPTLKDPNFTETVVLMLEHNVEGAVGLVVNRPYPGERALVSAGLGLEWNDDATGGIRMGGPVRVQAGCIVHLPPYMFDDTQDVGDNLRVSTSREALEELIGVGDAPFHLVLGYAGWGPGQLEWEMTQGTWLSAPLSAGLIFDTEPSQMYDAALATLGISRHDLALTNTAVN